MLDLGRDHRERSVELAASSIEEARRKITPVFDALKGALSSCFPAGRGYDIRYDTSEPGETKAAVRSADFEADLRAYVGRNVRYSSDGEPQDFFALLVEAEAYLPAYTRAEKAGEGVAGLCAWAGALGGGGLFVLWAWFFTRLTGVFIFSLEDVLLGVFPGILLGGWIGHIIGRRILRRRIARACENEAVLHASTSWQAFVEDLDAVLKG